MFDWLMKALKWVVEGILDVLEQLLGLVLDALATILSAIPVPTWVSTAQSAWNAIDGSVWFFLDPFQVPEGIAIIMSAYGIRFLIRRLPIFG